MLQLLSFGFTWSHVGFEPSFSRWNFTNQPIISYLFGFNRCGLNTSDWPKIPDLRCRSIVPLSDFLNIVIYREVIINYCYTRIVCLNFHRMKNDKQMSNRLKFNQIKRSLASLLCSIRSMWCEIVPSLRIVQVTFSCHQPKENFHLN